MTPNPADQAPPLSDEEIDEFRRLNHVLANTALVRRFLATIDALRERVERAEESRDKATASRQRWLDRAEQLTNDLDATESALAAERAKNEPLVELYRAVEDFGFNQDVPHDETGDPHDKWKCRTCRLRAAFGACALSEPSHE